MKFISHFTAAYHWNIPYIDSVFDSKCISERQINEITDITVTNQNSKFRDKKYRLHVCKLPLPKSAVIRCDEKLVASPELIFLELANHLDVHRLILLGLQLCSHPPGDPAKALTTKRKLKILLVKTGGHIGHKKAEHALQYIENGSASIMESLMYMLLSLPNRFGGYGLKDAFFNYEIKLNSTTGYGGKKVAGSDATRKYTKQKEKRYFVDLFYKKAKLSIEYDSFTHHSSPSAQGKDLLRATELEHQGIEVLRLSTIQLYNIDSFEVFVKNLASRLGKRIRIRNRKFDTMNKGLRGLLP